jgi:hypothetical protein
MSSKRRTILWAVAAALLGLFMTWGCTQPMASSAGGSSGPTVNVVVNNNTAYTVQIKMDSGGYVNIGGSSAYTFKSASAGTHTVTMAAMSWVGINGAGCSNAYSCTSYGLLVGQTYDVNITFCGNSSCTFICGNGLFSWGCPAVPTPTPVPTSVPVSGCSTVGLPAHITPGGSGFWISNATGCVMAALVDGASVGNVGVGSWYYQATAIGAHTVTVAGCGYSNNTSVSADAGGTHGVDVLCSGTGFYTLSTY